MTVQITAARMALLFILALGVPTVHAAGTAAGTDITNTASATFTDPDGVPVTVSSNTTTLKVDEVLDVTIVVNDASNVAVTTPDTDVPLSFTVTNTGNGAEVFSLSFNNALGGDQFDPVNTRTRLYLDDGDGILEIGTGDTLYVAGSNDPELAAGASRIVFMVNDMPAGRSNSDVAKVELLAEAITAQLVTPGVADAPGTTFAGRGTGGSNAVVGSTQADASGQNGYVVSLIATTFSKSQSVLGGNAIPGAVITYTLTFTATGTGSLNGSRITDPIPTNTTYVSGSLTLNAVGLTDIADADAGSGTSTGIAVDLGTVTAPATHTVTFKVTIN